MRAVGENDTVLLYRKAPVAVRLSTGTTVSAYKETVIIMGEYIQRLARAK